MKIQRDCLCSVPLITTTRINQPRLAPPTGNVILGQHAYYPGPTGEFTGPSVGHNYIRKNGTNLPIVALNRSPRDLSIVWYICLYTKNGDIAIVMAPACSRTYGWGRTGVIISIMNMLCKAMAAEVHSWGAPAICAYLSFAIIAFFGGYLDIEVMTFVPTNFLNGGRESKP